MAIATKLTGVFTPSSDPLDVGNINQLSAAFLAAGYTLFDSYTTGAGASTVHRRVFRWIHTPVKTFGTFYLEVTTGVAGSLLTYTQQLFSSWNAITHIGASAGSLISSSINTSLVLGWSSYNHPTEAKIILFRHNGIFQSRTMGLLKPSVVPANWDENQTAHVFNTANSTMTVLRHAGALAPNTASASDFSPMAAVMSNIGVVDQRRTVFEGIQFWNNSAGQAGGTFTDLAFSQGNTRYIAEDETSDGFTIILPDSSLSVAIRTS